jgi:hypothetical protein
MLFALKKIGFFAACPGEFSKKSRDFGAKQAKQTEAQQGAGSTSRKSLHSKPVSAYRGEVP